MVLNALYRNRAIENLVLSVFDSGVTRLLFGTLNSVLSFFFPNIAVTETVSVMWCKEKKGPYSDHEPSRLICIAELIRAVSDVAALRYSSASGQQTIVPGRVSRSALVIWSDVCFDPCGVTKTFTGGHCCRFRSLCLLAVSVYRPKSTE